MKTFMTKVTSFDYPLAMVFLTRGLRDAALEKLDPGDRILLVGTKGQKVALPERGTVLGMMESAAVPVDFGDGRKYGFGILNCQAWSFAHKPLFERHVPWDRSRFGTFSATSIVLLDRQEATEVLTAVGEPSEMMAPTLGMDPGSAVIRRSTGAPPPAHARAAVDGMGVGPAYTYLLDLVRQDGATAGHKIGWAYNPALRAAGFNLASLPNLGGLRYRLNRQRLWANPEQAFAMEQRLLAQLAGNRHADNGEVVTGVSTDDVLTAWLTADGG